MAVCRCGRGRRGWAGYGCAMPKCTQGLHSAGWGKKGCLWTEGLLALHPANVRSGPVALIYPAAV